MAAVLADRMAISRRLLQEAGPRAAALVAATNRYGQSALHIAARRGCLPVLQTLVETAAPHTLNARDGAGEAAAAIAAKHGHTEAAALLSGPVQYAGVPRSSQQSLRSHWRQKPNRTRTRNPTPAVRYV